MNQSYSLLLVLICIFFQGCTQNRPSISIEIAKNIKSGQSLQEIKTQLGEPHAPTSKQAEHLAGIISHMPDQMKTNAQADQSLAWGDDENFFVAKVNSSGIAWIVGWQSGTK